MIRYRYLRVKFFLVVLFFSIFGSKSSEATSHNYDQSTIQYSPEGKILQLEYAKEVVESKGGPICAMKCRDGILIFGARNKRRSRLTKSNSNKFFFFEENQIALGVTGLLFESKILLSEVKKVCREYRFKYDSIIPLEELSQRIANILHELTINENYRPLAIKLILAGIDKRKGPQIYLLEPDGLTSSWKAIAIGTESRIINQELISLLPTEDVYLSLQQIWQAIRSVLLKRYIEDTHIPESLKIIDSLDSESIESFDSNLFDLEVRSVFIN